MKSSSIAELEQLQRLVEAGANHLDAHVVAEVEAAGQTLPVHAITLGCKSPEAPALGVFGGVHGLERIGAEVALAFLHSLVERLRWDDSLHAQLERLRFVFMPLVNPGGLWLGTRANPRGVDLMRNAPVEAADAAPMVGGQRLSAALPWYRGAPGAPMEAESSALCELVARELIGRPFALSVDCHSGFGVRDRIWFPFAHSARPIDHLGELQALRELQDRTHPQHRYLFEPQSRQYRAHGDLWDHLYLQSRERAPQGVFLPLTLEMGSWLWVKKNPRQLFSRHGIFNPLIDHRQQRVLRRHVAWLDFLARAAASWRRWLPSGEPCAAARQAAMDCWYPSPET